MWLVTADLGQDSVLVVWDSQSGVPIKTIFNPNPGGVRAVAISDDSMYIATLGEMIPELGYQTVYIWKRDSESNEPVCGLAERTTSKAESFEFHHIVFRGDDPHELALNGNNSVYFMRWKEGQRVFAEFYGATEKGHAGRYTMTAFIRDEAVTATDEGKIVVWGKSVLSQDALKQNHLTAIKIVQVGPPLKKGKDGNPVPTLSSTISVLITQGEMIVAGFGDGSVKFYSAELKILMWFEKIDATEIRSISFSLVEPENKPAAALGEASKDYYLQDENTCPNFLVADSSGQVMKLKSERHYQPADEQDPPEILLEGFRDSVMCIAAHPGQPILALGVFRGLIQFWNYEKKEVEGERKDFVDKSDGPWVMAYTPIDNENLCLIVGCTDGTLKVIPQGQGKTLQEKDLKIKDTRTRGERFLPEQIIITKDGVCMATRDNDFCVSLFKFEYGANPKNPDVLDWHFSGKARTHLLPITSIVFAETATAAGKVHYRLFSIGEDMRLFEYDVATSTESDGLRVKSQVVIEQEARPSALLAYPEVLTGVHDSLLWFNTNYKAKLWDPNEQICRRTALGPVYAKEVSRVNLINFGEQDLYLAYATESKVIGLMKLPLDGNPHKTMGLIAHSGKIADICVSKDGKYLFSCGGKVFRYHTKEELHQREKERKGSISYDRNEILQEDYSVGMWAIDVTPIDEAVGIGGEGVEPFLSLIEGREEGQTYKDITDYFFYAQILSKDENTTKLRKLEGKVPLEQLANLMRAMGYYPTEMEIDNLQNEVRFANYEETGEYQTAVDLNEFIRLFVNHRPVYGINNEKIREAFEFLRHPTNGLTSGKR
jgi:WD40 repeat protein